MAQSTITARIDSMDKELFDEFCDSVGLNTSTAINLFVKAVLRENRIPFTIEQTRRPTSVNTMSREELASEIEKGFNQIDSGNYLSADEFSKEMEKLISR